MFAVSFIPPAAYAYTAFGGIHTHTRTSTPCCICIRHACAYVKHCSSAYSMQCQSTCALHCITGRQPYSEGLNTVPRPHSSARVSGEVEICKISYCLESSSEHEHPLPHIPSKRTRVPCRAFQQLITVSPFADREWRATSIVTHSS